MQKRWHFTMFSHGVRQRVGVAHRVRCSVHLRSGVWCACGCGMWLSHATAVPVAKALPYCFYSSSAGLTELSEPQNSQLSEAPARPLLETRLYGFIR